MPRSVKDIDLRGKRVFIRVDFNVPIKNGTIGDDTRIRASLPTIHYALDQGATSVILASHLGRPKGKPNPEYSLQPIAAHLSDLLERPVAFNDPKADGVVLLENLRFNPGEEKNDPEFAAQLAAMADVYINDAFGSAHRAHASTEGIVRHVKEAGAGLLMAAEVEYLGRVLEAPARPFVAILGGAKVSDKLRVMGSLVDRVDALLIGGAMAFTLIAAEGGEIGTSLCERDRFDDVHATKERARERGVLLEVPHDAIVASEISLKAERRTVPAAEIPRGLMGLDIGPKTVEEFARIVADAKTILWNGPMGVFELEPFSAGTRGIATAVAHADAFSVVGGGDSLLAVKRAELGERFDHLSTGGGASLEFLEGRDLPGISIVEDHR